MVTNRRISFVASIVLSCAAIEAFAESQMLFIADPAMNMIYGHPLDSDTTNSLVPISGSVTIVADSVVHLSEHEIAYVPNLEPRVAVVNLADRSMTTVATGPGKFRVCRGLGENDFLWVEANYPPRSVRLNRARRNTSTNQWEITSLGEVTAALPPSYATDFNEVIAVQDGRYAILTPDGGLYLYKSSSHAATLLNTMPNSAIARGPNGQILQFQSRPSATAPAVFDSEGNRLADSGVSSSPLLANAPSVVEWRSEAPQLAGIGRRLGDLVLQDTVETTPTLSTAHTTRDENGSVIPERDVTGAATLFRVAPDRWQFFNEVGGLQTLNTTTHQAEYQLQYTAGSGPEFTSIDAIASTPDGYLYVLDSTRRLMRLNTSTGRREILKVLDRSFYPFIAVHPDGRIFLVADMPHVERVTRNALVTVRHQGGEWVVEEGTPVATPGSSRIFDVKLHGDGVRLLWREEEGTRLIDLTATGAQQVLPPLLITSQAPTHDTTTVRFNFVVPAAESTFTNLVRLRWDFKWGTEFPRNHQLRSPSGSVFPIPESALEKKFHSQPSYYSIEAIVNLPEFESTGGTWTLELQPRWEFGNPALTAADFLTPVSMFVDPLQRAMLLAGDPGANGHRLIARRPASLVATDDATTTRTTRLLGESAALERLSNATTDAAGQVLLGSYDTFALWRVDPASGLAIQIADKRPEGLDGALLGRNGFSLLKLAVGPTPTLASTSGWVVN